MRFPLSYGEHVPRAYGAATRLAKIDLIRNAFPNYFRNGISNTPI